MSILSPVEVEHLNVNHKHPHYNPEHMARCINEQWVIMCDGREIKQVIGFDKRNRFVKYFATDGDGRNIPDAKGNLKTAYAKGEVHVFTQKDAL